MFDFLSEILILFIELLLCKMLCEIFGEVRHKGWINQIQFILETVCAFVVLQVLGGHLVAKEAVMICLLTAYMFWHVKIGIGKAFLLTLLYCAILISVEYVVYFFNTSLGLTNMAWATEIRGTEYFFNDSNGLTGVVGGNQYSIEGVIVILLSKVVVFLCILAIRKCMRGKSTELLSDRDWIRLMIFPIFTIIIVTVLISAFRYIETSEQIMMLFVGSFGMLGMNIVVFYIIRDVAERKEQIYENRIFRIQAENRAQMYRSISEGFDRQKRKTHEYKNHIICMQALLEEKQYEKLESYIKGIYGGLDGDGNAIDTNNVIVNAVLNTKYREAQEAGIIFALRINDLSGLGMKDEDVVTVLCNLLDNAIEACRECDGKKIIKLKFVIEDRMVKIGVRNTFQTPVVYEHGEIKTTKTFQKEEHGTGIKNIIEVIEKYGGSYVINNKDGEFYFSIVIPV